MANSLEELLSARAKAGESEEQSEGEGGEEIEKKGLETEEREVGEEKDGEGGEEDMVNEEGDNKQGGEEE